MSSVNGIYGKLLSWGVEESRWFKLCQQFEPSKQESAWCNTAGGDAGEGSRSARDGVSGWASGRASCGILIRGANVGGVFGSKIRVVGGSAASGFCLQREAIAAPFPGPPAKGAVKAFSAYLWGRNPTPN